MKKIFEEPLEQIDESWIHGAMIGGICRYDGESLASSYFSSAEVLITRVLESREPANQYLFPVLYLYRHGIELYLKAIVKPTKLNHSIGSLYSSFCNHVFTSYGLQVPAWISQPITQLAELDPESDLFRYEKTKNPTRSRRLADEGEFWVDFSDLRSLMVKIELAFLRVLSADKYGISSIHTVSSRSVY